MTVLCLYIKEMQAAYFLTTQSVCFRGRDGELNSICCSLRGRAHYSVKFAAAVSYFVSNKH